MQIWNFINIMTAQQSLQDLLLLINNEKRLCWRQNIKTVKQDNDQYWAVICSKVSVINRPGVAGAVL